MAQPVHIVAVTAIIERNGSVLILKRKNDEIAFPGLWTIPGGKVEIGATISETLQREVEEETGLKVIGEPKYQGDAEFTRSDGIHVVAVRFVCQTEGEAKLTEDFTDLAWVTKDQLAEYDIIPGIRDELKNYFDGS